MKQAELNIILEKHKMWLRDEENGKKADLSYANLSCADLNGADLSWADLSWANLGGADLSGADLSNANLRGANLRGANLCGANLSCTDLSYADLSCADLSYADLRGANLTHAKLYDTNLIYADLSSANLRSANLSGAKTEDVKYNCETSFYALQCPEVGSFTAFKKCDSYVVELFIPNSAKRSSATSRKCRADKAKVIAIYNLDKTISDLKEISSNYDKSFIYKVGKTVIVKDFDENRWNECSTGIHFFITFDEAKQY